MASGYRGGTALKWPLICSVFSVFFAVFLVSVSLQLRDDLRIQDGPEATALVQSVRIDPSHSQGTTSYDTYLRVRFLAAREVPVVTTLHVPGRHREYVAGRSVAVRYVAAHPSRAEVAGQPAVGWTGEIVAALFFVAFTAFTAYTWRARSRARRATAAAS